MTDHQMTVASFWLALAAVAVPLYFWLDHKANLFGEKQMRSDLKKMEGNKSAYANHSLRKMRRCHGFALYLLSVDAALFSSPWRALWPLGIILGLGAAVFSVMSAIYGDESTMGGVLNKIKRSRKRLGLPEEFSVRGVRKPSE